MILAQRGYQANAKTITVSDELLVDTLNIKR
jgi:flagellar hook protein FlgE